MNFRSILQHQTAPKAYSTDEALTHVKEGAAAAEQCAYDRAQLHCKGCVNSCLLSAPRCELGQRVADALEKAEKESFAEVRK